MKNKRFLTLLIISVLTINVCLILYNYLVLDKKLVQQKGTTLFPNDQLTKEVSQEKTKIPFESNYEIVNLNNQWLVLKGQKTTTMLRRNSVVNIYKGQGESFKEVSFSDLKIGQKIKIETKKPPEKGIAVYII